MKSPQSLIAIAVLAVGTLGLPGQVVEAKTDIHELPPVDGKVVREGVPSAPVQLSAPEEAAGTRVEADSDERRDEALWALDLYEEAGLDLPAMTIRIHESGGDDCGGHAGLHTRVDGRETIDVCTDAMWTLIHEIAHVWTAHNLTDHDRDAWVEHQGLEAWSGSDIDWYDRGTEQAADLITWALLDSDHTPLHLWQGSISQMEESYEALVGDDVHDDDRRG